MSADFLVDLSPGTRKFIKTLGLPIPMPQKLARDTGPWTERPLHDNSVVICPGPQAELSGVIAQTIAAAGANPLLDGEGVAMGPFVSAGEAWGRTPRALGADEQVKANALVFDATGITDIDDLKSVYDFFHARIRGLTSCGRVVIIGRPFDTANTVGAAAAQRALDGFAKAVGREVGAKGATSNTIYVDPGAEDRLEPVLRFFLSKRSAYVSGQAVRVTNAVDLSGNVPLIRPLEGKVALVTGAARGIGKATARALAREGAHVIVLDRPDDRELAARTADEVGGTMLLCDVTDPDAPAKIAGLVEEKFGGIDIIVHNAGVTRDKTLKNMDEGRWNLTLNVNLAAVSRITEALDPWLRRDGRIICLSSIAGIAGNFGQTNYAASKAGIIGYTEWLGQAMASRGIGVNAIAPGFIETRLTHAIPVATREVARRLSNLSQGGLPEDIAEVVTFLSTPGSAGLSGQIVRVCGGAFVGA